MRPLFLNLLICLSLTILCETGLSLIVKVRNRYDILIVVLAQVATNPLVVAVTSCVGMYCSSTAYYLSVAAAESVAVLAEAVIYRYALDYRKIKPLLLSLILNAFSFSAGLLISLFIK